MKKRVSFVSNSSSSSFIVSSEDNKYKLCFDHYDVLDLKEYCKSFLKRDIYCDLYYSTKLKIKDFKFVSNQEFSERFKNNTLCKVFPLSCRKLLEDYFEFYKTKPNTSWDSTEMKDFYEKIEIIENKILNKCVQALNPKWKDTKFHYAEINNSYIEDSEDIDVDNMCDLTLHKLNYLESFKPFKFRRYFSNH